ncbi:unnamed protein product [Closterium sp. NIES-64]|nr:unnamed protein product [Closterium sp. NIES-64]
MPAEFLTTHPPRSGLTLYHLVTRLPDTLRAVRDHFLARCPTESPLTSSRRNCLQLRRVLLAVGGRPPHPVLRGGCSPPPFSPLSPLLLLSNLLGAEKAGTTSLLQAGAAATRAKGGKGGGGDAGEAVVGAVAAVAVGGWGWRGLVAAVGVVAAAAGEVAGAGAGGWGGVDAAAAGAGVVEVVAEAVVDVEALALHVRHSALEDRAGQPCGRPHTTQRWFSRLDDAWRAQFPEASELPCWLDLLKKGVDIYALDFDAIITAMYVMSTSGEGAHYLRVPPDPGIRTSEAAALGASASAPPGTCVSATPGAGEAAALGAWRQRALLTPLVSPDDCSLADAPHGRVGPSPRPCPVICASAQPLAPCLLVGDLAHTAVDGGGWRCVSFPGLGISSFCPRYVRQTSSPPALFLVSSWALSLTRLVGSFTAPPRAVSCPLRTSLLTSPVPYYRLFPYRTAPLPPPPLFLAPGAAVGRPPPPSGCRSLSLGGVESGGAESGGCYTWRKLCPPSSYVSGTYSTAALGEVSLELGVLLELVLVLSPPRRALPSPQQLRECADGAAGGAAGAATWCCWCWCCWSWLEVLLVMELLQLLEVLLELLEVLLVLVVLVLELLGGATGDADPGVGAAAGAVDLGVGAAAGAVDPGAGAVAGAGGFGAGVSAGSGDAARPRAVTSFSSFSRFLSTAPQRVPLPSPPASSLPDVADPPSDLTRAASPTVARLLATVVTDPTFESSAASALVAELVDFAAACRLDYAASLVAESESVCPPSVGGECAFGTDVLEDRQEEFEFFAAALPHLVSMLVAPEGDPDAPDIPTPRSYAEAMEAAAGSPPAFKARYVARGFSQREGVDFFRTFSPTPKMTTLQVLLHVAAQRDYELHCLDFSTAFLQGTLHEEIWLRRPPGFTGSFPPGTQWSLRRPVYGLRQAPREWHDTLRTTLAALGFAPSTADPSLFLRTDTTLPPFYVLVYVDDLVFATSDTEALAHVKSKLQKRHTCTDLGELTSYLGLRITRDRAQRTITLTQSHMVQQVLQRFRFTCSSPQPTPLPTGHSLSALPSDESVEPSGPYPELVGCLMYLMTCTRPDLAYPLSILARYVAPGRHRKEHMDATKRVLRYLCSTSGMGLVLGGRLDVVLTGHSDASWADDQATQRSSQGYTFSLGSGSVSWRSTRSSSVLSSSCEAEIYATAMAAQELRWLTYLLTDLGERPRSPPVLYVDNKAAIALCEEHRLEHRTKHIALRYFLARELQQRGQLRLRYVATRANTADVFTKALQACDHQRFCTVLGLVPTLPHLLTS